MSFIPYGRQNISQDDIDAVISVLQSDFLTQGPVIKNFEEIGKNYCHARYAIAVANATAALHLACLALGVTKGDYVWTSPNTFVASANCALYCGAKVDFVDICSKTYNMSVEALVKKLEQAKKENKLPKVVIPVHFAGQSCNMKAIKELADQYGFRIIEDAAHAVGAKYLDKPVGSCRYSDITIFSFHPVKIITTAEGGLLTTNQADLAEKLSLLRSHSVTYNSELMHNGSEGGWYYEQVGLGFNYRITEMQCALGASQFKRLDQFVRNRHQCARYYDRILKDLPVVTPYQDNDSYSALHLYPIQLETSEQRKRVFDHLRENKIGVHVHYIPVYLQPYYQKLGFKRRYCPQAEDYYSHALSLPLYSGLGQTQQDYVIEKLREAL